VDQLRAWLLNRRNSFGDERLPWYEWFVIELGLNTGLRVAEMTDLVCGDMQFREELSRVIVQHGKGDKYREVNINRSFQNSVQEFLEWKRRVGQPTNPESPLLLSYKTGRKYVPRALQVAFKRCLKGAGITSHHSIHSTRHSYASLLYKSSNFNLRLVQKQLGHSSPVTTQVYANVFAPEIEKAVENLFSQNSNTSPPNGL